MTREEVFEEVESIVGAGMDRPFEGDFDTTVLRHTDSKKWFGIVMKAPSRYFYGEGHTGYVHTVTLKCDPFVRLLLQTTYPDCVYPAYHMNKKLWVSVPLKGDLPDEELKKLIRHSFALTGKKAKKQ